MTTFVLVHGAWHGAWCWYKVVPLLRDAGNTVIAVDLPSHGIDRTPIGEVSLDVYAERVCQILDSCGEPVVLVGHSMGGLVISRAGEKKPSKIAKLIYLTAFLIGDGQTLLEVAQSDLRSQILPNLKLNADQSVGTIDEGSIQKSFYHDCPASDVALAQALLVPQALALMAEPLRTTCKNWGAIPRFYIECVYDNAISLMTQRAMQKNLPCERVVALQTSHSPFFSAPRQLADHLLEIAGASFSPL
jgi:pimeloyl-ACP methyl ester carboxylesterase